MRNFLKLISFTSALLLAGISNQIYSSEQKHIDIKSNTLISNAIEEKEIKTVTANGFGTTLESAAQNAAENALTQVVGSFIDAETQIKKQKEIRDGVISKTKIIKKDIKDYSQGSIKYFEILNIQENGSIFNVTARVDVRIEDFRNYIKQLALNTKEISTTNLFAEMGAKTKNLDNKFELLKKIILPVRDGEVIDISIDDLQTAESFINSKDCANMFPERFCDPNDSEFHSRFNVEKTVVFLFSLNLKKDFIENSLNILENISDKKTSSITSIWGKDLFRNIEYRDNYDFQYSEDIGVIFRNHQKQTISNYYILGGIRDRFENERNKLLENNVFGFSKLRISLIDNLEQPIYAFEEQCNGKFKGELRNMIFENIGMSETNYQKRYIGRVNNCPSQLYTHGQRFYELLDFTSNRWFGFAFEVNNLDILKDFKEIKIEYLQN